MESKRLRRYTLEIEHTSWAISQVLFENHVGERLQGLIRKIQTPEAKTAQGEKHYDHGEPRAGPLWLKKVSDREADHGASG